MKKIAAGLVLVLVMVLALLAKAPVVGSTNETAGSLIISLAPDTPLTRIVAVGSDGTEEIATKVNLTAANETIAINSITVQRIGGRDSDFAWISLWDSGNSTQIGVNQYLVGGNTTIALPPEYTWLMPKGVIKTLDIKAKFAGIQKEITAGAVSGDTPKIRLTRIKGTGVTSGHIIDVSTNVSGNEMILRRSKPIIAAASLPSAVLSTGEKTLFRGTVAADAKGDIEWKDMIFEISGSIRVGEEKFTIGSKAEIPALNDAVYMQSSNGTLKKLILAESLRLFNAGNGEQLQGIMRVWNFPDKALISFDVVEEAPPASIRGDVNGDGKVNALDITKLERIIAGLDREEPPMEEPNREKPTVVAGGTKTYELRGNLLYDGKTGDIVMTRIPSGSVNNITFSTFSWSDGITWATDYLVPGLPSAALSSTK